VSTRMTPRRPAALPAVVVIGVVRHLSVGISEGQ
jgi:hypothetical protein